SRTLRNVVCKLLDHRLDALRVPRCRTRTANHLLLVLRERDKQVLFGRKVIEESPFCHIGGGSNLFHPRIHIALLGEELQRRAKETLFRLGAAATPPGTIKMG